MKEGNKFPCEVIALWVCKYYDRLTVLNARIDDYVPVRQLYLDWFGDAAGLDSVDPAFGVACIVGPGTVLEGHALLRVSPVETDCSQCT